MLEMGGATTSGPNLKVGHVIPNDWMKPVLLSCLFFPSSLLLPICITFPWNGNLLSCNFSKFLDNNRSEVLFTPSFHTEQRVELSETLKVSNAFAVRIFPSLRNVWHVPTAENNQYWKMVIRKPKTTID